MRLPVLPIAAGAVLLVLAIGVAVFGEAVLSVTGFKPLGGLEPEAIDEPIELDDREAPRFLAERNRIEVEVPRAMTLESFLRLYQIDFPHVRRQIAQQSGVESLGDDFQLAAGRRFSITLTPPGPEID